MARINVEDSIHKDSRFINLCITKGGRALALGVLVEAWIVAQQYHLSHGEIPSEVWVNQNLDDLLIETGLAERTSTGVRMCGQNEQFAWLENSRRGGKKSAESRAKTNGTSQPKRRSALRKKTEPYSSGPEGYSTSYSSSSSFSFSSSSSSSSSSLSSNASHSRKERAEETPSSVAKLPPRVEHPSGDAPSHEFELTFSNAEQEKASLDKKGTSEMAMFIAAYVEAYQDRYGSTARPYLGGKVLGQMKIVLNESSCVRACALIRHYLTMDDTWFQRKAHDFITFTQNIDNVALSLDTGRKTSNVREMTREEKVSAANKELMRKLENGELR